MQTSVSAHTGLPNGFAYYPEYFTRAEQRNLLDAVTQAARGATPFYQPTMPRTGTPLSVVMSNFGTLGWVSDKTGGYRYQPTHPKTGEPWAPIPDILLRLWESVTNYPAHPEACLINWYRTGAKMGMHVDADEQALNAPIVSISLGDSALYRLGGRKRGGKTISFKLTSGDVVVLADDARQCYHGIDKIYPGTSTLVPKGGRINLTMRRVMPL